MLRPNIFRFLLTRNIANADYKELFVREHLELAEIVAAGDGDGAQRMAASHLEGAYTRLLREIEDDYKEAPPESDPMQ
jgi:DNA-binding GntR family transcriptional regulator